MAGRNILTQTILFREFPARFRISVSVAAFDCVCLTKSTTTSRPAILRAYRDGRTGPAETLAVSDGLAACAECRAALAALDRGPAYEELAAAADGTLDPAAREALAARLTDDPAAAVELADLEAFRREMEAPATRHYRPPVPAAPPAPAPGRVAVVPARRWQFPTFAAVAAAVVLLAVLSRPALTPVSEKAQLLTDRSGHHADLAGLPADVRSAVEDALRTGELGASPALAALRPPPGTLAGTTEAVEFRALSPVGTVTRDLSPALRWTRLDGATSYVVTLMEVNGDHPWTSGELPATQTSWTPPHPLTPGATYLWQVEAQRGSDIIDRAPKPPAPEARFQVLADAQRAELARLQGRYDAFPLVMAAALARDGLTEEAASQLDRLAQEHPGSPLAQRLRRASGASK